MFIRVKLETKFTSWFLTNICHLQKSFTKPFLYTENIKRIVGKNLAQYAGNLVLF